MVVLLIATISVFGKLNAQEKYVMRENLFQTELIEPGLQVLIYMISGWIFDVFLIGAVTR